MKVLVIGGTNFIGPDAVRALVAAGHAVTVFHRGRTEADLPPSVDHLHGDRRALADHRDAVARLAPDVVLDMVPLSGADARAVVETCRGLAGRLVAISSGDAYRAFARLTGTEPGPPDPVPLGEDAPLRERRFPYRSDPHRPADDPRAWADDYDKILVEEVVLGEPTLPGTVLRLPMVYGERDRQHRLGDLVRRMDAGRPAVVLGAAGSRLRLARAHVTNVGAAIALAVGDARAAGRVYNVADPVGDIPDEAAWTRLVGAAAGWAGEVVVVPDDALPEELATGVDPAQDLLMDSSRIRAELGYAEPVPRAEALARAVAWERANPAPPDPAAAARDAAEDAVLAAQ